MDTSSIQKLSDSSLIEKLQALSVRETEATVELLLHLAEVDKRKLYLPQGFSSLFSYCTEGKLKYSEPAANRRIACARAIAKFPDLAEQLLSKELSLTTLSLAAGVLDEGNKAEVLSGICGRSRREVEEFLSSFRPKNEVKPERIKAVTVQPRVATEPQAGALFAELAPKSSIKSTFAGEGKPPTSPIPQEKRYEISFSVKQDVFEKLEEAKLCLSGKYGKRVKVEDVLAEALELLLEKRSPKRRQARRAKRGSKPAVEKPARPPVPSRHIPKPLRDQVYERDGGQCAYVSAEGHRCQERSGCEVHHLQPFARDGAGVLDNLALRCRAHNCLEAVNDFGAAHMMGYLGDGWRGISVGG